jgi:integrase
MATVLRRPDSNSWHISFRHNGRRYRESAGEVITKADAEQFLAKRQREVQREDIYEKAPEKVSFASFADDWLATDNPNKRSKDRDECIVEMLKVEWPGVNVTDIAPKMIEDFKAKRLRNWNASTVARDLTIVKRMFKKCAEWGHVKVSPAVTVQKPRVNNGRVRFLSGEELARLLEALPEDVRRIALFARFTGTRQGEILKLTWNNVDMKRGTITYRDTKNGDTISAPMNASTRRLLESLPAPINRAQSVFGFTPGAAAKIRIGRAWRPACETAKVTDFRFHDLRHQAATDLLTMGAGINDVRDFLRHKSMAMTLRYAHLVDDRRATTARLLDRLPRTSTEAATGNGEAR